MVLSLQQGKSTMKEFSNRIWVLLLGVAVAAVIALALIFNGNSSPFSGSPDVTQKPAPASTPSVLFKKVIDPIISRVRL